MNKFIKNNDHIQIFGLGEQTHGSYEPTLFREEFILELLNENNILIIMEDRIRGPLAMNDYLHNKILDCPIGKMAWKRNEIKIMFENIKEKMNKTKKDVIIYGCDPRIFVDMSDEEWNIIRRQERKLFDTNHNDRMLMQSKEIYDDILKRKRDHNWDFYIKRDIFMGNNVIFLANQYKEYKVIFFAHMLHCANIHKKFREYIKTYTTAGHLIKKQFEDKYLSIAFVTNNGEFACEADDLTDDTIHNVNKIKQSVGLENYKLYEFNEPKGIILWSIGLSCSTDDEMDNDLDDFGQDFIFVFDKSTPSNFVIDMVKNYKLEYIKLYKIFGFRDEYYIDILNENQKSSIILFDFECDYYKEGYLYYNPKVGYIEVVKIIRVDHLEDLPNYSELSKDYVVWLSKRKKFEFITLKKINITNAIRNDIHQNDKYKIKYEDILEKIKNAKIISYPIDEISYIKSRLDNVLTNGTTRHGDTYGLFSEIDKIYYNEFLGYMKCMYVYKFDIFIEHPFYEENLKYTSKKIMDENYEYDKKIDRTGYEYITFVKINFH